MSFGTGHHATTRMMMLGMLEMDFTGKEVLDFGTGTGILAILAGRLGASSIDAIDNDHWSISNVNENIQLNAASNINVALAENLDEVHACDMLLANINKHVLLAHAASMAQLLRTDGFLLISGLLAEDKADIEILTEGETLRIRYDKETETKREFIHKGIAKRAFDFAWKISKELDLTKANAIMDKGLLTITIPYAKDRAPKRLTIK